EAVEVLLEDVREGGLGVGGEAQRALPEVLREVVRERGGRRRLSEAALAGGDNDLRDAAALLEEAREAELSRRHGHRAARRPRLTITGRLPLSLVDRVGEVALTEDPLLPRRDVRDRVREDAQRVVRREHGDPQHVA